MQEIFKPITELNGKYECSNFGRVRRVNKDPRCEKYKYLKMQTNKDGYVYVHCTRSYRKLVHRIVCELFIDNPNNYPYVNHIDLNKTNNHVSNLEWVNAKMNSNHANVNGKMGNSKYIILDNENGVYYESAKELSLQLNKNKRYISNLIKNNKLSERYQVVCKEYKPNYEKAY